MIVNVAARLERLPFSRWHWGLIALALITWLTEAIVERLDPAVASSA